MIPIRPVNSIASSEKITHFELALSRLIPRTSAMANISSGIAIIWSTVIFSPSMIMPYSVGIIMLLHCTKVVNDICPYLRAFRKNICDAAVTAAKIKAVINVNSEQRRLPITSNVINDPMYSSILNL